jgi:hypothetical protein
MDATILEGATLDIESSNQPQGQLALDRSVIKGRLIVRLLRSHAWDNGEISLERAQLVDSGSLTICKGNLRSSPSDDDYRPEVAWPQLSLLAPTSVAPTASVKIDSDLRGAVKPTRECPKAPDDVNGTPILTPFRHLDLDPLGAG